MKKNLILICLFLLSINAFATLGVLVNKSSYVGGYGVSCKGLSDGWAEASYGGGTPPYTIVWSNAGTTARINSLSAGTYSVTVTDSLGATASYSVTLTEPSKSLSVFMEVTNISCHGKADGYISASPAGGTPSYSFEWNHHVGESKSSIDSLGLGVDSVVVTDANGCTKSAGATITQPGAITLSLYSPVHSNGFNLSSGHNDGAIELSVSGGTQKAEAPYYSFHWSNGPFTQNISNLSLGQYSVEVTDKNSCVKVDSIFLTSEDSLSPDAVPFNTRGNRLNASEDFIGTIDSSTMVIKTNNTERMRIDASGNVGIGTTNPTESLEVRGIIKTDLLKAGRIMAPNGFLHVGECSIVMQPEFNRIYGSWDHFDNVNDGSGFLYQTCPPPDYNTIGGIALGETAIPYGHGSVAIGNYVQCSPGVIAPDYYNWGVVIGSGLPTSPLINPIEGLAVGFNSDIPTLLVAPGNGSGTVGTVGIGTIDYSYKLNVDGHINASGFYLNGSPIAGSQWTTNGSNIYYSPSGGGNVGIGFTSPSDKLAVNGTTLLEGAVKIDGNLIENGFIGIGVTSPTVALEVQGSGRFYVANSNTHYLQFGSTGGNSTIETNSGTLLINPTFHGNVAIFGEVDVCKKFIVHPSVWCDFAFDKTHKILSYKTLEDSIFKERRLPGMPSEPEIITTGIDVASMFTKQMLSIEDAYLYIIELNKRIVILEQKLEDKNGR